MSEGAAFDRHDPERSDRAGAPPPRPAHAPIRPALTSAIRSPLEAMDQPRPRVLTLSIICWLVSCLAGFVVVLYFGTRIDEVRSTVELNVRIDNPTAAPTSVQTVVDRTVAIALGMIALPILVKLLLTLGMGLRRNWARILLAIVGILALPLSAGALTLLTEDALDHPLWVVAAVGIQEVLVLAGLVMMFFPTANAWYRTRLR